MSNCFSIHVSLTLYILIVGRNFRERNGDSNGFGGGNDNGWGDDGDSKPSGGGGWEDKNSGGGDDGGWGGNDGDSEGRGMYTN